MSGKKGIESSPREHFMRAVGDDFSRFERKEKALRQAERDERAARLKLPVGSNSSAQYRHITRR
jgi:hypothetical protein